MTRPVWFRYRLQLQDGRRAGEVTYGAVIQPGEEILVGGGRRFRVVDVVPFEEADELSFLGTLKVEAA